MKKTITVTREDLKNDYSSNRYCPIAQALNREFPEKDVFVAPSVVYLDGKRYNLPKDADRKAKNRAQSTLGRILGGFKFDLEV